MYSYNKPYGYKTAYIRGKVSAPATPSNVALSSAGATATADVESLGAGTVSRIVNGTRNAQGDFAGVGGFQQNGTGHYVEITFASAKSITEVDIIFADGAATNGTTDPANTTVTSTLAVVDYRVQYWDGSAYQTLLTITANDKQWRQHTFGAISTTKMKFIWDTVNAGAAYLLEIEAWGV